MQRLAEIATGADPGALQGGDGTMTEGTVNVTVDLHLTRQQFMALYSLVLDRLLDKREAVTEWVDVATDQTVTVDDLLTLFSGKL
jgi:hypothetical protein